MISCFMLYSMEVLPYTAVEFNAIYSESCVSHPGDLPNGCVITLFMPYCALEKQKGEFQIKLFWGFSPAEVGVSQQEFSFSKI